MAGSNIKKIYIRLPKFQRIGWINSQICKLSLVCDQTDCIILQLKNVWHNYSLLLHSPESIYVCFTYLEYNNTLWINLGRLMIIQSNWRCQFELIHIFFFMWTSYSGKSSLWLSMISVHPIMKINNNVTSFKLSIK